MSKRRIVGRFLKQSWGGRKGNEAISCGSEEFDATSAVLLMSHQELLSIEDGDESSDELGRDHVQWEGPCEVYIVDAIKAFFGVEDLEAISEEMLELARAEFKPVAASLVKAVVSMELTMRVTGTTDQEMLVKGLKVMVESKVPGAVVLESKLVPA